MDTLNGFYEITLKLLPGCGIILLILLCVAVWKLIKVLNNVNEAVDKGKTTVDQVNYALGEIQKPLSTVVKISSGLDLVYDYSEKTIKNLVTKLIEFLNYCKEWLFSRENKESKEEDNGQEE